MFRHADGSKAQYHDLTLMIAHEFAEWHVIIRNATVMIRGGRQTSEATARDHARLVADNYIHEQNPEGVPKSEDLTWTPLEQDDWLTWRA
jgi:hypothetical protein